MLKNKLLKTRYSIIRAILKVLCFVLRTGNYVDKASYWPWLKIMPSSDMRHSVYPFLSGDKIFSTHSIGELNTTVGSDFAIVGSGPSIQTIDFSKLKHANFILLNGAIRLIKEKNVKPCCCVIIDASFAENRFDLIKEMPLGTKLITTIGVIRAIYERDKYILHNFDVYLTKHLSSEAYVVDASNQSIYEQAKVNHFSDDLDVCYCDGGTVMYVGIQLSVQLSATRIYLLGFDIGNCQEPRFYEKTNNTQKSGLLKDYENKILPAMKIASNMCKARGIEIFNCSKVTKLPYEVIPYFDFYQSK